MIPTVYATKNELPRPKFHLPSVYAKQAAYLNLLTSIEELESWINFDSMFVLPKGTFIACKLIDIGHTYTCCPIYLKKVSYTCNRWQSTSYCSKECQRRHWRKQCHKQVCQPNPSLATFEADLVPFHTLRPIDLEPHEILLLKQTEKLRRG